MKRQVIIDKVYAVMGDKAGIAPDYIEPEDSYEGLGLDFAQFIEALVKIEDEFAISIPSEKLLNVFTMQNVFSIVEQAINDTHGFEIY